MKSKSICSILPMYELNVPDEKTRSWQNDARSFQKSMSNSYEDQHRRQTILVHVFIYKLTATRTMYEDARTSEQRSATQEDHPKCSVQFLLFMRRLLHSTPAPLQNRFSNSSIYGTRQSIWFASRCGLTKRFCAFPGNQRWTTEKYQQQQSDGAITK